MMTTNQPTGTAKSSNKLTLWGLGVALVAVVGVSGVAIRSIIRTPTAVSEDALDQITPTIERQFETIPAIVHSARTYLDQEKPGRAQTVLEAAIAEHSREQQFYFLLGEALLQQEQVAQAYEAFDQGIWVGEDHAEYRFAAGTLASQLGRLDDAEIHFRRGQKLDQSNPKYPLYLAQVQRKLGLVDEAKASLLTATRLDPELAHAWSSLAAIALDENKLSIARGHITRARELEPNNLTWRVMEAQVLRRSHEPGKSVAILTAIDPQTRRASPGVLIELGRSYGLLQQPKNAAMEYIEATAAHPEIAEYPFQAAVWLERSGEAVRALMYARQASKLGHADATMMAQRLAEAGE